MEANTVVDQSVVEAMFLAFAIISCIFIGLICSLIRTINEREITLKAVWGVLNYKSAKLKLAIDSNLPSAAILSAIEDLDDLKQIISEELNLPSKGE